MTHPLVLCSPPLPLSISHRTSPEFSPTPNRAAAWPACPGRLQPLSSRAPRSPFPARYARALGGSRLALPRRPRRRSYLAEAGHGHRRGQAPSPAARTPLPGPGPRWTGGPQRRPRSTTPAVDRPYPVATRGRSAGHSPLTPAVLRKSPCTFR